MKNDKVGRDGHWKIKDRKRDNYNNKVDKNKDKDKYNYNDTKIQDKDKINCVWYKQLHLGHGAL